MEAAIANLYNFFLTNTFECKLFLANKQGIVQRNHDPLKDKTHGNLTQAMLNAFNKIVFICKDAPSSKSWALEKLSDIICQNKVWHEDLLSETNLIPLMTGFFDQHNNAIRYPDFVLNEVTKILTAVLMSNRAISKTFIQSALSIIRSPFDYGVVDKGHRIQTVFQCLQRLLQNPLVFDKQFHHEFDFSYALAVCLTSCHNYTRKSSKDYIIKLIEYAFEQSTLPQIEDASHGDYKNKELEIEMKRIIIKYLLEFNANLVNSSKKIEHKLSSTYDHSIPENYLEVLCSCANASDVFCTFFDAELRQHGSCLFDTVFQLLKDIITQETYDCDGHLMIISFQMLIRLSNLQQDSQIWREHSQKLTDLIFNDLCGPNLKIKPIELMSISRLVLLHDMQEGSTCLSTTLLEISLIPVLLILGVPLTLDQHKKSGIVSRFTKVLKTEFSGRLPVSIDFAVRFAFELDSQKVDTKLSPVLNYVTMKTGDYSPIVSQPFLRNSEVKDSESFVCLLCCLKQVTLVLNSIQQEVNCDRVQCIWKYVEALMNSTFSSHEQLLTVFKCFLALLRGQSSHPDSFMYPESNCVSSVIASLQLHLVSMDFSIREVAVKCLHELYLIETEIVMQELSASKAFSSLWHCMKDQAETVVSCVLDFLLCMAGRGMLPKLLPEINLDQDELNEELKGILLSNSLDTIKATAFQLLSTTCQTVEIVRYAEVLLATENPRLALTVLKFMQNFFENVSKNARQDPELLCDKLIEGWGDLLFSKVNSQDVSAFRIACDILLTLHNVFSEASLSDKMNEMSHNVAIKEESFSIKLNDQLAAKNDVLEYLEDLNQSFQNVHQMTPTEKGPSDLMGGMKNDFDTPLSKRLKLERQDKSLSDKIDDIDLFLYSVIKPNKEKALKNYLHTLMCRNKKTQKDNMFIDSTRELPTLILEKQPFPSQELVCTLLGSNQVDLKSTTSRCLVFIIFKELLTQLNIQTLHEEAYKSTDQYENNEETILEDLDNQLEMIFLQSSRSLEKEIVGVLIMELQQVAEDLLKNVKDNDAPSNHNHSDAPSNHSDSDAPSNHSDSDAPSNQSPLTDLRTKLIHLTLNRKQLLEHIISQRKTVFTEKWTPNKSEFILDEFLGRLKHLKRSEVTALGVKNYFSSSEDLMHLLDTFQPSHEGKGALEIPSDLKKSSLYGNKTDAEPGISSAVKPETSKPVLNSQSHQEISALDINLLQKSLDEIIQLHENQNNVNKMSVLDWMKRMTELLCCPKESLSLQLLEKCFISINRLNIWYSNLEEDEFDDCGDNDPTSIDCF